MEMPAAATVAEEEWSENSTQQRAVHAARKLRSLSNPRKGARSTARTALETSEEAAAEAAAVAAEVAAEAAAPCTTPPAQSAESRPKSRSDPLKAARSTAGTASSRIGDDR